MIFPVQSGRVLVAVASAPEMRAIAPNAKADLWSLFPTSDGIDLVLTGVGKANAAGGVARVVDPGIHRGVISLGIGGCLPDSALEPGARVVATRSVFSDEGILAPTGFQPLDTMGFPPAPDGDGVDGDADWIVLSAAIGLSPVRVATVSSCSATDGGAKETVRRTGAKVEAMEGAAVGVVAARLGLRFLEIRVVSNTTGDRDRQKWNLSGALESLREVFHALQSG